MKLTYLGTAAAEGWPAVFCRCDNCMRALNAGGRNIRTRSQAMINDDFLFDFPTDTYEHALHNRIDLSKIEYVFFTHSHVDHCTPIDLVMRRSVLAHNLTKEHLTLYGSERVKDRICEVTDVLENNLYDISFEKIENYHTYEVGNYKVTPLKAFHVTQDDMIYIVESEGKTLLYLHDTGPLYDEAVSYLVENKIKADLVSYDCTFASRRGVGGHLGLDTAAELRDKFLSLGIIDEKTVNILNHFSHNGESIYDEFVPIAAENGFIVSYDGMTVEI